jgi:hypothetical protein
MKNKTQPKNVQKQLRHPYFYMKDISFFFLKREHGPSCIFSEWLLDIPAEGQQGSFLYGPSNFDRLSEISLP